MNAGSLGLAQTRTQRFVTIPNSNAASRIYLQSNCHHGHYIEGTLWLLGIAIKGCFWLRIFQVKWFLFLVLFLFAAVFSLLVLEVPPVTRGRGVFNALGWLDCLVPVLLKLWGFPRRHWDCSLVRMFNTCPCTFWRVCVQLDWRIYLDWHGPPGVSAVGELHKWALITMGHGAGTGKGWWHKVLLTS